MGKDRLALDSKYYPQDLHVLQSDSKEILRTQRIHTSIPHSNKQNLNNIISQRCHSRHETLAIGERSASYA